MKLSDVAYQRFKERLFSGDIPIGATMSQAELVKVVGVPISPLREAMQVLQAEGLLQVLPRSGIRIVAPDTELIKNTYQLRRILEREALACYLEVAIDDDVAAWRERHQEIVRQADAVTDGSSRLRACTEVDKGFHAALLATLRNPIISRIYERNNERIELIRLDNGYSLTPQGARLTMREHLAIIDAVAARDAAAAQEAMAQHLNQSLQRAMGL